MPNKPLHTKPAALGVLARADIVGAAVICELGR
jgi:hypothetical protein